MRQPATGSSVCSVCDASYESETKLREHLTMSHRKRGNEQESQTSVDVAQPEDPQV
jgi:hypothetical protein